MSIVEKQIVLRSQFNFNILNMIIVISLSFLKLCYPYKNQYFDSDGLKGTYFLWPVIRILNPQLERSLSIIQ